MSEKLDELIMGFPIFAGATKQGARVLRERAEVRELARGTLLFSEGDPPASVALVLSGTLEVFVVRDGRELSLTTSGPGAFVGELGVLCGLYRTASVRAAEDSLVLEWSAKEFRALLFDDPALSHRIFKALLRTLIEKERVLIDTLSATGN